MSIITLTFLFIILGIIGGLECYILIKFTDIFQKMNLMSEVFKLSADRLTTLDASRERVYESIKSVNDSIIDQYKNLFEQYKLLKEAYDNISDGFLKVCDVIKEIDEHSAVTCDQFEEISKALADIYAMSIEIKEEVKNADDSQ